MRQGCLDGEFARLQPDGCGRVRSQVAVLDDPADLPEPRRSFEGSALMSEEPSIIIVKRRKRAAHGHHGGAWKVAYADFVTAMMAFFLVMWILGVGSREQ